jgi:hypothetical protein
MSITSSKIVYMLDMEIRMNLVFFVFVMVSIYHL